MKTKNETNNDNFRDTYYFNLVRENIIMYRNIFDLTIEKLSEALDYTLNYISQIESIKSKVNCPLPLLGQIANFFNIPITEFFIEHKEPPTYLIEITDKYIQNFKKNKYDDKYYYEIVRKNIRKYRKFYKLSQADLSIKIGFNEDYISCIESPSKKQNFTIATIGRIADAFEISIVKLFEQ